MKNALLILGIIVLTFASCTKDVNISSVTLNSRLVVNALLNDKDKIVVSVSYSTVIQDSVKPPVVKNAVVEIIDNLGNKTNCVFNLLTNKYECNITPNSGESFSVTVTAPGFSQAFAQLRIPNKASYFKSTWRDSASYDKDGFPQGKISVKLNDNGSEKNYYRISLFYYQVSLGEWNTLKLLIDDAELENQSLKTEDGGIVFKDANFNGKQRTINFTTPFGFATQTPKFLAVIENLSEQYYNYFKSIDDYKNNSQGVFSEAIPVFSNIRNGLGIFAGSSIQRDTIQ